MTKSFDVTNTFVIISRIPCQRQRAPADNCVTQRLQMVLQSLVSHYTNMPCKHPPRQDVISKMSPTKPKLVTPTNDPSP